jgi:predicted RNase H-like nuclease (RuvC/YqgF family)
VTVFDREVKKELDKKQKAKPRPTSAPVARPEPKQETDYERWQYIERVASEQAEQIERLKMTIAEKDETIQNLRTALSDARQARQHFVPQSHGVFGETIPAM